MKKLVPILIGFFLAGVAAASPNIVSTTQISATVENLDCGTKYRFEIRKYTDSGELGPTAEFVDAQTKSCLDTQSPSQPQSLAATGATQTSISVSWTASTDDVGVTGYDLYRGGAKVDSTSATSYTFGGLSCDTSYTLAVEAHDAAGNRSSTSAITASTNACPQPSCPTGEYTARYYGNMTLSGTPVLQRCEAAINHGWGEGSPATGVAADRFSARWTGTFSFSSGTYQFTATTDDGIRVWVDGALLIDAWKDQPPSGYQATRILTAGDHDVKVEYYENGGGATARLSWQLSQLPPLPGGPIASELIFPGKSGAPGADLPEHACADPSPSIDCARVLNFDRATYDGWATLGDGNPRQRWALDPSGSGKVVYRAEVRGSDRDQYGQVKTNLYQNAATNCNGCSGWYALGLYFPVGFVYPDTWFLLYQNWNTGNPAQAIELRTPAGGGRRDHIFWKNQQQPTFGSTYTNLGPVREGHWHYLLAYIELRSDGTGVTKVWYSVDAKPDPTRAPRVDFVGNTLYPGHENEGVVSMPLYRAASSDPAQAQVVYYCGFRRAGTVANALALPNCPA